MTGDLRRRRARARYAAVAAGVLLLGIAGYGGFVAFATRDSAVSAGVLALAAATGFAAFFSPCSFPLLLTFLTRKSRESPRGAVTSAATVAAGAATLLALMAGLVALGGSTVATFVSFDSAAGRVFRATIAVILIGFGFRQLGVIKRRSTVLERIAAAAGRWMDTARSKRRLQRDFVYGFGYLLAGFG